MSEEIAGALGLFFHGGSGPSHSTLTGVFARAGYGDVDRYLPGDPSSPNKETRVQTVVRAAVRRPNRGRELVDGLLAALRLTSAFTSTDPEDRRRVAATRAAFRRAGWTLSEDGSLSRLGTIDLVTGGRHALDEQVERLRRSTDDPGQLIGAAKDLLEAVAKLVLEELGYPAPADFNQLWYLARERLGVHPSQVVGDGAAQVRRILGASWTIAAQVNELRNLQRTGHGRTLPTGSRPTSRCWWCARHARSRSSCSVRWIARWDTELAALRTSLSGGRWPRYLQRQLSCSRRRRSFGCALCRSMSSAASTSLILSTLKSPATARMRPVVGCGRARAGVGRHVVNRPEGSVARTEHCIRSARICRRRRAGCPPHGRRVRGRARG